MMKSVINTVVEQRTRTRPLTSEDLKFCQDCRKLVVVDPIVGLMLLPQSSEGFIVQIKLCMKETGVNGRRRAVFCVQCVVEDVMLYCGWKRPSSFGLQ